MKRKRKSPKAIRQEKVRWGILNMGLPFTVAGSLNFGSSLPMADPSVSFTFDYDTGIHKGDYISIVDNSESVGIDHRLVHVARRRQSKGKTKKILYVVRDASATCITVKANKGTTITYA